MLQHTAVVEDMHNAFLLLSLKWRVRLILHCASLSIINYCTCSRKANPTIKLFENFCNVYFLFSGKCAICDPFAAYFNHLKILSLLFNFLLIIKGTKISSKLTSIQIIITILCWTKRAHVRIKPNNDLGDPC